MFNVHYSFSSKISVSVKKKERKKGKRKGGRKEERLDSCEKEKKGGE